MLPGFARATLPGGGSEGAAEAPFDEDELEEGPPPPAVCPTCAADGPAYDYARAAAVYGGVMRDALHRFKFGGRRTLAQPLADLAVEQCGATLPDGIGAVVPVPLARDREWERGFNQAALLAERIAKRLDVPIRAGWLARQRATKPQSDLPAAERSANVRGAFRAAPAVADRHVLLVDDVLTTGATLGECARALRAAGARRIGALTVARVR
jgi:ComF family protein